MDWPVERRSGWRLMCCSEHFTIIDPSERWLSECCQFLLVDVLVSVATLIWLAFLLDIAARYWTDDRAPIAHSLPARLCVIACVAATVCSVLRCVAYTEQPDSCRGVAGWASPIFTSVAWGLLAVLVRFEGQQLVVGAGKVARCLTMLAAGRLLGDIVRATILDQQLKYELITSAVQVVAALAAVSSSWFQHEQRERESVLIGAIGEAERGCWLGCVTFSWVNTLMWRGVRRYLTDIDDLFQLPIYLRIDTVCARFSQALSCLSTVESLSSTVSTDSESSLLLTPTANSREELPLLRALFKCYGGEYVCLGLLKLVADLATFAGPLVLGALLLALEEEHSGDSVRRGSLYASLIFLASSIAAVAVTQYDYRMDKLALKVRSAFTGAIYRKLLRVPLAGLSEMSSGQVVTLLGVDVDRVTNICNSFHAVWSLPLQFALALWMLYNQVSVACFVGLVFAVCLVPLNKYIANKVGEYSAAMLEHKDRRVKLMSQVLRGIYTVKLCCLESTFSSRIDRHRRDELLYLRKQKYLDAWCVFFWSMTPAFITVLTFGTYVLLGNQLKAANVFTTIALMRLLNNPINAFPWVLNGLVDAFVSLGRLRRFLAVVESDRAAYFSVQPSCTHTDSTSVLVESGRFSWHTGDDSTRACLHRVHLQCSPRQLTVITGALGSGKSSLLYALTGEVYKQSGCVHVAGSSGRGIGLVSQRAWLCDGSVRDNIVAGAAFDRVWYERVLDACCLSGEDRIDDTRPLVLSGDACSLSGGQRMRVCLARAVYRRCAVYLLDDVLAALDACVARHVVTRCILGLLRERTVIASGSHAELIAAADQLVNVAGGNVQVQCKEGDSVVEERSTHAFISPGSKCSTVQSVTSVAPPEREEERRNEEEGVRGSIGLSVLSMYYRCLGTVFVPLILLTVISMQAVRNGSELWLGIFVSPNATSTTSFMLFADWTQVPTHKRKIIGTFLSVYGGAAAAGALIALARAFLFAMAGVRAAELVHNRLVSAVLHTGFSFFSRNPTGRILNRFSSDVYTVDDSLPFILNIFLAQSSGLIGVLVVSMIGLPWIIVLYIPLTAVYLYIQNYYRHTSRELKRLSTVSLSPLYSHFVETIDGLATIRALCDTDRMILEFMDKFDSNQRVRLSARAAVAWLNFRLQAMGVTMVTAIAMLGVAMRFFHIDVHSGIFGLAISYALSITGSLNAVVNAFTETEKELISVERLDEYMKMEAESDTPSTIHRSPSTVVTASGVPQWPQYGSLVFRDVSLVYEETGLEALSGVSFELPAGSSLGVVGRTGAGKSSLLAALLRLHRVSCGQVLIDNVDVSSVDVLTLRRAVSVLPQQSFVFSGTVRDNIDPSGQHSDAVIWSAITACHLRDVINGLEMEVDGGDGGQQLSSGQLQLLCLARVLVRGCRLLCLDEATANVDARTDSLIQATLQSCLRSGNTRVCCDSVCEDDSRCRAGCGAQVDAGGSTVETPADTGSSNVENTANTDSGIELFGVSSVLSISHRISAVIWCDAVIVLQRGRVVESSSPTCLLQQPSSAFYAMFQQQN